MGYPSPLCPESDPVDLDLWSVHPFNKLKKVVPIYDEDLFVSC